MSQTATPTDTMDGNDIAAHREGPVARTIEEQTAKLPSDLFLWGATGAAAGSLLLHVVGRKAGSMFLGQWVPTLLILGVYNKIVKTQGHDHMDRRARG